MESNLDSEIYNRLQNLLKANPSSQAQLTVATLLRLLQNINEHPEEAKYRSIKKSNKAIQAKLLTTNGIVELLDLIGFRAVDSDTLTVENIENVEIALIMTQAFESEMKDTLKTEEEKENDKRQLEIKRQMKEKEEAKKRLLEQAALDRKETNNQLMPTQDSRAINRAPVKPKTFKDIGVDLNTPKKG